MKKKYLFLILILLLTGCSYKELNNLAIASAIGIDYENNEYTVSAQILNIKKNGDQTVNSGSLIYEASGKTISDAIRNISLKYPNTLYLGHLELLVIGKGEIEHGINNSFDYFIRTSESRNDATLLISKENNAKEILNPNKESNEEFPTKDILTTIETSMKRNGKIISKNLEEFISDDLEEGIDQVVSIIKNTNNPNKDYKNTILEGIAVFKNNKYIGTLSDKSAIAYTTIKQKYDDVNIVINYKGKNISIGILNPQPKIDLEIKNDNINVTINIPIDGIILEYNSNNNLTNKKILNEIEKELNKELKSYIDDLLEYSKINNVDIIGLKSMIYKKYYNQYNNYKKQNIYKLANIKTNIHSNIYRYGDVNKGFIGENYE